MYTVSYFVPTNRSIVSFLRRHLRASLARSSNSMAIRSALPTNSSLFFLGRPMLIPPVFHNEGQGMVDQGIIAQVLVFTKIGIDRGDYSANLKRPELS
jgi:hypothetical protein